MRADILNIKNKLLIYGFVIIDNIVSHDHLSSIYHKMIDETYYMMKNNVWGGVGSLKGHIQQNPPRYAPYIFNDVLSNPVIIDTSQSILGNGFYNDFYSANTNCPGSVAQPVHSDCTSLWEGNLVLHPPVSLVINIPLVDVDENNGSIELWPGSHQILGAKKYVDENMLNERRKIYPPIRANMHKGSVLIRDVRTWHRGMPNHSNKPRHMLAMIHHVSWLQRGEKLAFAKGCENTILDRRIDHHIYFTDESIDHSIDPTLGAYSTIENV